MSLKGSEPVVARKSSSSISTEKGSKMSQESSIPVAEAGKSAPDSPTPSEKRQDREEDVREVDGAQQSPPGEPKMQYYHGIQLVAIVVGLCFGIALVALDGTLLATAIPTIVTDFNSIKDIGWYVSTYFIAISALQPPVGRLFQMFSPKWLYLACIGILAVGSLVCALAPSSPVLIVGRAITGLGGAGLLPGSIIIISFVAEPKLQPPLNGLVTGIYGLSSTVAPVIGGAFTEYVTWRWCFWLNLPLAGFAAFFVLFFFNPKSTLDSYHLSTSEKLKKLDWLGFILFGGGNAMLLLGLQWGGDTYPWNSSTVIGLLVGAGVTLAVFAGWQWYKGEDAGFPSRIISNPVVVVLAVLSFLAIGGFQILTYYLPIYFQAVKGVKPNQSGVMYLPTVIADLLSSILTGGLVGQVGYYNPFYLLAFVLYSVGLGLATTLKVNSSTGFWIGLQILAGAGNGMFLPLGWTAIQANIPLKDNSIAIACVVYFQLLGASVFQAIAHQIFQSLLTDRLEAAQVSPANIKQIFDSIQSANNPLPPQLNAIAVPSYQFATTRTFFASVAAFGVAFFVALTLRWKKFGKQALPKDKAEEGSELQAL